MMRKLRVGCLPVVLNDRLVGIVTEEDFMEIASKMLEQQLAEPAAPPKSKPPGHSA
jgi:CBS-domain-containing membrane protein